MNNQAAQNDFTRLLESASQGDVSAADRLFPVVYDELRRLAQSILRGERPGHTLQATALVHEAFVKLIGQNSDGWRSRSDFMSVAAQAMRRILVDHARTKKRLCRGGGAPSVSLNETMMLYEQRAVDLEALDDALTRLATIDPLKARLVELRFFGGLTMQEAGSLLDMPLRTAEREWMTARAWLRGVLKETGL